MEPVALPETLDNTLRSYQKDGVAWLRFLETNLFCGILADEMGLGKTLQTLVWIQLSWSHPEAKEAPALIVCPTSLVENWFEEAGKFVPAMRVLVMHGSDRHPAREFRDGSLVDHGLPHARVLGPARTVQRKLRTPHLMRGA